MRAATDAGDLRENYTILLENDDVRVLEFRLAKGATETTHQHPANVAVFLTDVNIRFTLPNRETRLFRWIPGVGVEPVLERSGYTGTASFPSRERAATVSRSTREAGWSSAGTATGRSRARSPTDASRSSPPGIRASG